MIEPTAPQSIAIMKLARMVAGSSTLRERAGLDDVAIWQRIYLPAKLLDPTTGDMPEFPCVNIEIPGEGGAITFEPVAGGAKDQFRIAASLMLCIWDRPRYEGDENSSFIDFANFEGHVVADALQLSSVDSNLVLTSVEQVVAPEPLDENVPAGMRFYLSAYMVNWRGVLSWDA